MLPVELPTGWGISGHQPGPSTSVRMSPRSPSSSGLAPCITLTTAITDLGVRDYLDHLRSLVRDTFERVDIEDADIYDFQGADVVYVRFFHRTPRHDVIVEIWNWITDGRVWSMAASADHRDHPDYTDVFDDVAATFDARAARLAS